jgi:hypothetical protein
MNYQTATGKTIEQAFISYHEENPEVFEMFKKYLNEIITAEQSKTRASIAMIREHKKLKTSAKMILNRIRWEIATVGLKGTGSEENASNNKFDSFKINDAFSSRYARLFSEQNPDWSFLFNQRALRS